MDAPQFFSKFFPIAILVFSIVFLLLIFIGISSSRKRDKIQMEMFKKLLNSLKGIEARLAEIAELNEVEPKNEVNESKKKL